MSCGFKSHLPHTYSSIAQSVEHAAVNRAVVGSSPTRGVMQKWRNWQTRTVQVRVVAIPWGFDSLLLHDRREKAENKVMSSLLFLFHRKLRPEKQNALRRCVLGTCYCSRFAQTATDFADASHSRSAKSATSTVFYGIFSSENAYPWTVTGTFFIFAWNDRFSCKTD